MHWHCGLLRSTRHELMLRLAYRPLPVCVQHAVYCARWALHVQLWPSPMRSCLASGRAAPRCRRHQRHHCRQHQPTDPHLRAASTPTADLAYLCHRTFQSTVALSTTLICSPTWDPSFAPPSPTVPSSHAGSASPLLHSIASPPPFSHLETCHHASKPWCTRRSSSRSCCLAARCLPLMSSCASVSAISTTAACAACVASTGGTSGDIGLQKRACSND